MNKEWLTKRTTIEGTEREHSVRDEELGRDPVPFGFQHKRWTRFKGQIKAGDELWEFSSPEYMWRRRCGRAGICIVRNGEIVNAILTKMS